MLCIAGGFCFGGRDAADRLELPGIVVPVDPFDRGVFDGVERSPRSLSSDYLGFVESVDRLSEIFVVAVADAARGWFKAGRGELLGVLDRCVLRSGVRVLDENAA